MLIFKIIGICLIVIGLGSGAGIFLEPFGLSIQGSTLTIWLLFVVCFVGGFLMYGVGAKEKPAHTIMRVAGSFLLVYGLVPAASFFMGKIGLVQPKGTGALWALFILCTLSGITAVITAEEISRKS